MNVIDSIFKAYDIRGIYPTELNKELAFALGRAFAQMRIKETQKEHPNIVVSSDSRLSSPELSQSLIEGLQKSGANVYFCGVASTPTFYFVVGHYAYDGGVQITASHNPKEYNGFKLVRADAAPVSIDSGIMELKKAIQKEDFLDAEKVGELFTLQGVVVSQIKQALGYVNPQKIKKYKIVVDSANGVGALMFEELSKQLNCEFVKLNFELDGTFPVHEADPLKEKNNVQIKEEILRQKADLGIALDGDADRLVFFDEKGQTVEPAILRGILSQIFLRDFPGGTICYDIRPGKITQDMIIEAGGKPVVTRVGHSLIKEKAREVGAVFAGESSGHYFVLMPFGFFEEPIIITLKLLQELSQSNKTFSQYIAPLHRYFHSGEINFKVLDKPAVFDHLLARYKENLKYDFDGLSFEYEDWWFNVRPSNTENLVRLNLEARSEALMKEKVKEVEKIILG